MALIKVSILGSIVVSIPACHAGDQGSIPCRGDVLSKFTIYIHGFLSSRVIPSVNYFRLILLAIDFNPSAVSIYTQAGKNGYSTQRVVIMRFANFI